MLVIGLIDDESYALNYVKLNSSCLVYYIIKGGPIDFENFIFNYDQVFIEKNENQIEIQIEGVEDIEYYPTATKIPECLINDKLYYEKLINSLIDKLSYRLEIILDRKVKIKKKTLVLMVIHICFIFMN